MHPVHMFGFDEVIAALSHIRGGQYTGNIVFSHWSSNDVQLPTKPAMKRLRLFTTAFYQIVGVYAGFHGSPAVYIGH